MLIFAQLEKVLRNSSSILATIIKVNGSVPREMGAKMIITSRQETYGTIGGGAGEAKVIEAAILALKTGQKQLIKVDLSGESDRQTEGICGGIMQVWLEPWYPKEGGALAREISTLLKTGQTVSLVTPLDGHSSPYLSTTPKPLTFYFLEILEPPPLLLIVGAGHVGEQLAKVAHNVGFQIVIQDDRPSWANLDRYPQAIQIFNQSIDEALKQLNTHTLCYVALVTRGYQYDLEALEVLLKRAIPCQYIGMIGSKKRVNQVYQNLQKGGVSSQQLKTIYAPIGLDIGALTPEEIAVSIVAELIRVRRGGTGLSLSKQF